MSVKRFVACVSYLSISPSLSHVSPILAVPALSLRHHVPDHILAELSRPKSARHAQLRTSTEEFGYQAKSGLHTSFESKEFDKITVDDPDLDNISDCSKTTRENTELLGVPTVFEISVLQVS